MAIWELARSKRPFQTRPVRQWGPFAVFASLLITASGCDKVKQAVGDTSLPASIAAFVEPPGVAAWLDIPLVDSCSRSRDQLNIWVFTKPASVPFPQVGARIFIARAQRELVDLAPEVRRTFRDGVIKDLIDRKDVEISSSNPGWGTLYCPNVHADNLGGDFSSYTGNDGSVIRALVSAGSLTFRNTEYVSTFQKMRSNGVSAEHRKYHLLGDLIENPKFGGFHISLQRDIVVYFDPEDRQWRLDPDDQSTWYQAAT